MSLARHSVRFRAFHMTRPLPLSSALFFRVLGGITGQGRTRVYLRGRLRRIQPGGTLGILRSWLEALSMLCQCLVGAVLCVTTAWLFTLYATNAMRRELRRLERG